MPYAESNQGGQHGKQAPYLLYYPFNLLFPPGVGLEVGPSKQYYWAITKSYIDHYKARETAQRAESMFCM